MRRKSILDQVEDQEAKRKNSEKTQASLKMAFTILGALLLLIAVVSGVYVYQYIQPTEAELLLKDEEKRARDLYNFRLDGCQDLIKKNLNYPSSYRMKTAGVREIDVGIYVHISFTAKNSFGAELPQSGQCAVTDNGMVLVDIRNR